VPSPSGEASRRPALQIRTRNAAQRQSAVQHCFSGETRPVEVNHHDVAANHIGDGHPVGSHPFCVALIADCPHRPRHHRRAGQRPLRRARDRPPPHPGSVPAPPAHRAHIPVDGAVRVLPRRGRTRGPRRKSLVIENVQFAIGWGMGGRFCGDASWGSGRTPLTGIPRSGFLRCAYGERWRSLCWSEWRQAYALGTRRSAAPSADAPSGRSGRPTTLPHRGGTVRERDRAHGEVGPDPSAR
jgi:hypothetical protein